MAIKIVEIVKKRFEEKNEGKKLPDSQKSKAREMESALETFSTAVRHFEELRGSVDIDDIKKDIQVEVDNALR